MRFVSKVLDWALNLYKIYRESKSKDLITTSLNNINKDDIKRHVQKKKQLNKLIRLNNLTKKKCNKKMSKKDSSSTDDVIDFVKYVKSRWHGEEGW